MAHFYPKDIENIPFHSDSEKLVYKKMKEKLDDTYHVLYSVTRTDEKNLSYECDFVVLHKQYGFAAIEVKGGEVTSDGKNTFSKNRNTRQIFKVKNPGEQAKASMFAIKQEFKRHMNYIFPLKFTWGVILPDSIFDMEHKDLNAINTLDSRHLDDIDKWLVKLFENTAGYTGASLTDGDIDGFITIFSADLQVAYSIATNIIQQEEKIKELDRFQDYLLDLFDDKPRIAFEGAAGTGKTWIAMKKAHRLSLDNKSVLFLCFNKELNKFVETNFTEFENVKVATFHSVAEELIITYILSKVGDEKSSNQFLQFLKKTGINTTLLDANAIRKLMSHMQNRLRNCNQVTEIEENRHTIPYDVFAVLESLYCNYQDPHNFKSDYYDYHLPLTLLDIFQKGDGFETYDAIIIDEAQDFKKEWCDCINYLFENEKGKIIYIFYDENQNIFTKNKDLPIISLIGKRNLNHLVFKLTNNMRNTREIHDFAIDTSGIGKTAHSPSLYGLEPVKSSYTSLNEARKYIGGLLHDLINIQKVSNDSIIILSNRSIENSIFADNEKIGNFTIKENSSCKKTVEINYNTIQRYKGLEKQVVILLWHNRPEDREKEHHYSDELKYIGATRAKFMLYWVEVG